MIWPILEARTEIFSFVQMKSSKSHSEINWPLGSQVHFSSTAVCLHCALIVQFAFCGGVFSFHQCPLMKTHEIIFRITGLLKSCVHWLKDLCRALKLVILLLFYTFLYNKRSNNLRFEPLDLNFKWDRNISC